MLQELDELDELDKDESVLLDLATVLLLDDEGVDGVLHEL